MLILRLAWRSFVRHRRRSIITLCAISISLAMMIAFVGMADDGHARMAELGIRMGSGHVVVQGKGYQKAQTIDHLVHDPAGVARLARSPEVTAVVPRVRVTGLLAAGERSAPVMVSGVDPRLEVKVSEIAAPKRRTAGHYLRRRSELPFSNQPADLYIGVELAAALDLAVGDRTVLTVSPRGASRPASAAFFVRGIFKTGVDELDGAYVEAPIGEMQELLGLGSGVTQVAVLLRRLEDVPEMTRRLRRELPPELEVLPWTEVLRELHEAIMLDDAGLYMLMAIIFVIAAIGIFNTMLMSVIERTREFGVMLALGTSPGRIFAVVLAEGLILAAVGAVAGAAVGLGIHALMATKGVDITSWASEYEIAGIVFEGRIYSRLTAMVVTKWTLVVMGITAVASLYPALRSTRLQPVEAIHRA